MVAESHVEDDGVELFFISSGSDARRFMARWEADGTYHVFDGPNVMSGGGVASGMDQFTGDQFAISWSERSESGLSMVHGQVVTSTGEPVGDPFVIEADNADDPPLPLITATDDGSFRSSGPTDSTGASIWR